MSSDCRIPIIVGITGHRQIEENDAEAISSSVSRELSKISTKYPNSEIKILCSMAEGGDTICAKAANKLGIKLIAGIPFEIDEFRKDFKGEALEEFNKLISISEKVIVTPDIEGKSPEDRDYYYRQNSIYVASHCHILLALWDGLEDEDNGCGTSSAVSFALEGDYLPRDGIAVKSSENTEVIHVFTPRGTQGNGTAGEVKYLGDVGAVEKILSETDRYNSEASEIHYTKDNMPLSGVYYAADLLSAKYKIKHEKVLWAAAIAGTLITLSFLFYDELETWWMLLVCGILLVAIQRILRKSRENKTLSKHIEYRALAEIERVRDYLRYAGSRMEIAPLMTRTQLTEHAWIAQGETALDLLSSVEEGHDISSCWIEDQINYHRKACQDKKKGVTVSANATKWVKRMAVLVYFTALGYELMAYLGLFSSSRLAGTIFKILVGILSAASLLLSASFGKQAVERQSEDHKKMQKFYERMLKLLKKNGQNEELLKVIVREELNEVGNWCSYKQEESPSLEM